MKPATRMLLVALALSCLALPGSLAAQGRGLTLEVTITNLTSGQIMSPPVVISHGKDFRLFEAGDAASAELAMLAEDAVSGPLIASLGQEPEVFEAILGPGPILPGSSVTVEISANGAHRWISVAGMLVTTNDAFYAVRALRAEQSLVSTSAVAYDAGSEANNEDCDFIPGPPCDNPNERTPTSEGFIHVHNGVHGLDDLPTSLFDWRNPVARVSVRFSKAGS